MAKLARYYWYYYNNTTYFFLNRRKPLTVLVYFIRLYTHRAVICLFEARFFQSQIKAQNSDWVSDFSAG